MAGSDHSETKLDGWYSPDPFYHYLAQNPVAFKPKSGGAKNAGKRTGVYTFQENQSKRHILIKQADPGEMIAEFVGSKLYGLTMPEQAAECVLFRDETSAPSLDQVYVGSVYAQADSIQDAFTAAGYQSRGKFAGTKAKVSRKAGKNQSLIHKILAIDKNEAEHSLAKPAANALWHGDHDFHAGNFVLVEKNGKKYFMKIDHGFSLFNFDPNIINIGSPTAGKVVSFKFLKKQKEFIEFFPTNHYWDILQADPHFFQSPHFLSACEEICQIEPKKIKSVIQESLEDVIKAYDTNAIEALILFGQRIGMQDVWHQDVDTLKESLTDHIVCRLLQRQASLRQMKDQAMSHVERPYKAFSSQIQVAIDNGNQSLNAYEVKQAKYQSSDGPTEPSHTKVERKRHDIVVHQRAVELYDNVKEKVHTPAKKLAEKVKRKNTLQSAVYALALLKEANDRGFLKVNSDQTWGLTVSAFESRVSKEGGFLEQGGVPITENDFKQQMESLKTNLPRTQKMLGLEKHTLEKWMRKAETIEKKFGRLKAH